MFCSLFFMRWLFNDGKWTSGLLVFLILAYTGPRAVEKLKFQFIDSFKRDDKKKAKISSLKMLFLAQGYFLAIAFAYYVGIWIITVISKGALHLEGLAVVGVFFTTKVIGLLIINILMAPIVWFAAGLVCRSLEKSLIRNQ